MKVIRLVEDRNEDRYNRIKKLAIQAGETEEDAESFAQEAIDNPAAYKDLLDVFNKEISDKDFNSKSDYIKQLAKDADKDPIEYANKLLNGEDYNKLVSELEKIQDSNNLRATTSNVNINDIRKAFENNKAGSPAAEGAKSKLKALFSEIGTYGSNNANNISKILDKYDFKFIRYFLECLDYENLGDHNNQILTALANPSAKDLLDGDKLLFTRFFNLANSDDLGINSEYLNDSKALIFDRGLYNATNQETLEGVINSDTTHQGDDEWRNSVRSNIVRGNLSQFASKEPRQYRKIEAAIDTIKQLKGEEINKFLINLGVDQNIANRVADQIRANENSNKY